MKKILRKVLDELQKEKPDISYVRGLLEAVVEEDEGKFLIADTKGNVRVITNEKEIATVELDEAALLDAKAKASIDQIKKLSEISQNA